MKRPDLLRIWWLHIQMPLALFVLLAGVLAATHADLRIAHALFFDQAQSRWIGAGSWWTNAFLHTGGRWFIRAIVVAALALWLGSYLRPDLLAVRRPAAYFFVTAVLSISIVGFLKTVTHVHCPWDLTEFGGRFHFVGLFAGREQGVEPGKCFPAAHASTGYALLALYFVFRERGKELARLGLTVGASIGLIFGIAQQSRGAHFLSHDAWSAFIVWMIAASIYTFAFKARLWNGIRNDRARFREYEAQVASGAMVSDAGVLRGGTR